MSEIKDKNYYEILEIGVESSEDQVHQGYIRSKNAYSQDSMALYSLMSEAECNNILNLIEEAYSILSDPDKRRQYDEARGLTVPHKNYNNYNSSSPIGTLKNTTFDSKTDTSGQKSMVTIMANKRFQLEFEPDQEIEKEIEETTEFTGEFLKKIREYKKVTIPRLADMTKVSKTYLLNIEEEDTSGLPALVYVRGFVYQYAKCLKLNPELVANSFLERIKRIASTK